MPAGRRVGTIETMPGTPSVLVRPLREVFEENPVAGTYVIEGSPSDSFSRFRATLAERLSVGGAQIQPSVFVATGTVGAVPTGALHRQLGAATIGLLSLSALFAVYLELHEGKRGAVLRLDGYGTIDAWYVQTGRSTGLVTAGVVSLSTLVVWLLPGAPSSLGLMMARQVIMFGVVVAFASVFAHRYLTRIRLDALLKNRKDVRGLFVFSTFVRGGFAVLAIVAGAGLWGQFTAASKDQATLEEWTSTRDYAVFTPLGFGNDTVDSISGLGPAFSIASDLYPLLDAKGALFIDAGQYTPTALGQPLEHGTLRSVTVNPNYLAKYPILGEDNQPLRVADNSTCWTVIVPATMRSEIEQVRQATIQSRRAITATATRLAGASSAPEHPDRVCILVAKSGQEVFTFNVDVAPQRGNRVRAPMLQVMTLGNSSFVDRLNSVTGDINGALKVRLLDRSPEATLRGMTTTLKTLHLEDNLRTLVTLPQYSSEKQSEIATGLRFIGLAALGLLVVLLALATQGVVLAFERWARQAAVRKLLGYSVIQRHREFFIWLWAGWMIELTLAIVADRAGGSVFSTDTSAVHSGATIVLLVAGVAFFAEAVVALFAFRRLETRRLSTVLKEQF